jgi:hypothetical protein
LLDELRQWGLPRLLSVVVDLAELHWVETQFPGHLHVRIGQPMPFPRIDPRLELLTDALR